MITKKMESALNEQINAELWSAYLYLAMSLDAEEKALKGIVVSLINFKSLLEVMYIMSIKN